MNILVTGANGQLGNEMQIVSKNSNDHYIFTDVCEGYTHLDITNLDDIRAMVKDNDVRCIINCAAWTNVDGAETAGEIVETLNATAPENLATAMKEVGGLLVHVIPELAAHASCLAGKGACPEEDCGGVWGYEAMKESGEIDPHDFDLDDAHESVKQIKPQGFGPMFAE